MNAIVEISEDRRAALADRLMALAPAVVDVNLQTSLRRLLGKPVEIETERRYPENGPYVTIPIRAVVRGTFSTSQLSDARRAVDEAMTPAPDAVLGRELTRLALTTAHRAKGDLDMQLMAAAYIDLMRKYPADVAVAVIRKPRQWWPTAFELSTEADALVAERRLLLDLMVIKAPTPGEATARALLNRPHGPRKLPEGWREAAGIKSPAKAAPADPEPWNPDLSPVKVSGSFKAALASKVSPA